MGGVKSLVHTDCLYMLRIYGNLETSRYYAAIVLCPSSYYRSLHIYIIEDSGAGMRLSQC